jgi:hypothetical protein
VNRFIGSSPVVTTVSSYTLKITVTTAHGTSHTKSSNSSSGSLGTSELKRSQFPSRILSYPLGRDHAQKTVRLSLHGVDHTENTCHLSDCEFIGPLAALGVARTTWKTQPHLLLRVGPCLKSCYLATRLSNPLQYFKEPIIPRGILATLQFNY